MLEIVPVLAVLLPDVSDFLVNQGMKLVLPLVIAPLALYMVQLTKKGSATLDRAPGWVKDGFAVFFAAIVAVLAPIVGTALPTDPALWDVEVWKVILGALLAIITKHKMRDAAAVKVARARLDTPTTASPTPLPERANNPFDIPQ